MCFYSLYKGFRIKSGKNGASKVLGVFCPGIPLTGMWFQYICAQNNQDVSGRATEMDMRFEPVMGVRCLCLPRCSDADNKSKDVLID